MKVAPMEGGRRPPTPPPPPTAQPDIWTRVLERLEKRIKLWDLGEWFAGTALLRDVPPSVVVAVPSDIHKKFLKKRFAAEIREALQAEGRVHGTVTFEVCDLGRPEIRPNLRCLAEFTPEPISWLWPGRIALGKLTLIVGDPGLGKSWIAQDITARITAGSPWPDRQPNARGTVILLDAENGKPDIIRPRIELMGGEVKRVHILESVGVGDRERGITLSDLDSLRVSIERVRARLVVIDPVSSYLGSTDSHRDGEVRALLGPLQKLAESMKVAIVGIMHRAKGAPRESVLSACGSIAFTAAARVVLLVARDPDADGRRMFGPLKTNLSTAPPGLAYRLTVNDGVRWERTALSRFDPSALLACEAAEDRTEQADAEEILRRLLKKSAVIDAREATKIGGECFITPITMRRASRKLGLKSRRVGGAGALGKWVWVGPKTGS
jgi:RecA-family ATPase